MLGKSDSHFATCDHDLHRIRRASVSRPLSKQAIRLQEPVIQTILELLCQRVEEKSQAGEVVDVWPCYVAFTSGVIHGYSFGTSLDYMNDPDFGKEPLQHILAASMACHILKQFPWLLGITELAPDCANKLLSPPLDNLIIQTRQLTERVKETIRTKRETSAIFDLILLDPNLPTVEKDVPHLVDTAKTLTAAGTHTTATALKVITYFVLADTNVLSRLLAELKAAQPDPDVPACLSNWSVFHTFPLLSTKVFAWTTASRTG